MSEPLSLSIVNAIDRAVTTAEVERTQVTLSPRHARALLETAQKQIDEQIRGMSQEVSTMETRIARLRGDLTDLRERAARL